jgi:hypothetical protein
MREPWRRVDDEHSQGVGGAHRCSKHSELTNRELKAEDNDGGRDQVCLALETGQRA